MKRRIEARLLSFLFLYISKDEDLDIGAGDLASIDDLENGLDRSKTDDENRF